LEERNEFLQTYTTQNPPTTATFCAVTDSCPAAATAAYCCGGFQIKLDALRYLDGLGTYMVNLYLCP
jgi:hypothetical protein